jgi:hypothetical protein
MIRCAAVSLPLRPLSALERMRSFSSALTAKIEDETLNAFGTVKESVKNANGTIKQRLGSLRPDVAHAASATVPTASPAPLRHGASAPNLSSPHVGLDL